MTIWPNAGGQRMKGRVPATAVEALLVKGCMPQCGHNPVGLRFCKPLWYR